MKEINMSKVRNILGRDVVIKITIKDHLSSISLSENCVESEFFKSITKKAIKDLEYLNAIQFPTMTLKAIDEKLLELMEDIEKNIIIKSFESTGIDLDGDIIELNGIKYYIHVFNNELREVDKDA